MAGLHQEMMEVQEDHIILVTIAGRPVLLISPVEAAAQVQVILPAVQEVEAVVAVEEVVLPHPVLLVEVVDNID